MFKIYGVTDDQNSHEIETMDTPKDIESTTINVEMREKEDIETDIGQIAVDILDCKENITIIAPIAGVDPSDIDIGLSRNILTISGNRKKNSLYKEAKRMLIEECFYGAFSRSIILPENLAFDTISAQVDFNVIYITIPKLTLFSKNIKIEKNNS